jgi:hypothetical protein
MISSPGSKEKGVYCAVHYQPLHLHPYYTEKWATRPDDFPGAEAGIRGADQPALFLWTSQQEQQEYAAQGHAGVGGGLMRNYDLRSSALWAWPRALSCWPCLWRLRSACFAQSPASGPRCGPSGWAGCPRPSEVVGLGTVRCRKSLELNFPTSGVLAKVYGG